MHHTVEDDLRALWREIPAPSREFLDELRRSVEQPGASLQSGRLRWLRRNALAAAAAFVLVGAAAYAASDSPFYSMASNNAIVSNPFRVADPTSTSLGDVPFGVVCNPSAGHLACVGSSPAALGLSYVLSARVGAEEATAGPVDELPLSADPAQHLETVWTFATDGSQISLVNDTPPIIACPTPSSAGQLMCVPVVSGQAYPAGTPIYESVLS